MAPQLHPGAHLLVKAQQHAGQVGGEDETARREMRPIAAALLCGDTTRFDEGEVLVAKVGLAGIERLPRGQIGSKAASERRRLPALSLGTGVPDQNGSSGSMPTARKSRVR
ncbi:hypothetical protein IWX78_000974 [Mycetocola sp. CAN_C7]|uniref:hypothetical protein n=1 Tax=Mycetocola sp. CAN_C7 TaxID=2787724 RepID=UPI001A297AAD